MLIFDFQKLLWIIRIIITQQNISTMMQLRKQRMMQECTSIHMTMQKKVMISTPVIIRKTS
jgi:hypothetical protein